MVAMTSSAALRDLADRYWEARLEASPLFATFLGDHRYDDRVDDLSEAGDADQRACWSELLEEVRALDPAGFDETDRVTHDLLAQELADNITGIDTRLAELASDQMQGVHAGLLTMAGQLRAAEPAHAAMAVVRVERLGTMLDQAVERFRAGLAAGRTPARICITRSLNQVDGYLASPLEQDPFANLAGPPDWDGETAWRVELATAVTDHLRPAFERYRAALADELAPVARDDEHPGLHWLDDGPELYRTLIGLHTGLDLTAEELHEVGRHEVLEVLPAQFREIGRRVFGTDDLAEIFRHLLDDPELRYRDGDEILAHATHCLEAATAAMGDWFGIVPEAPCVLTPIPDYLAADAPAAYYTPPAPDGSRPGEYHVNLHDPTTRAGPRRRRSRSTRPSRATTCSWPSPPSAPISQRSAASRGATPPMWKVGRSTPSGWPRRWGSTRPTSIGSACWPATPGGRVGWWWTRGCTRWAGAARRRSTSWWRTPRWAATRSRPRSTATSACRARRSPTRWASARSSAFVRRPRPASATGSRCPGFHDVVLGAATVSLPVLAERVEAWTGR